MPSKRLPKRPYMLEEEWRFFFLSFLGRFFLWRSRIKKGKRRRRGGLVCTPYWRVARSAHAEWPAWRFAMAPFCPAAFWATLSRHHAHHHRGIPRGGPRGGCWGVGQGACIFTIRDRRADAIQTRQDTRPFRFLFLARFSTYGPDYRGTGATPAAHRVVKQPEAPFPP